jgi:hypothetical protein
MATQDFDTGGQGLPFHERSQRPGFRQIMFSETQDMKRAGAGRPRPGTSVDFALWPLKNVLTVMP